MKKNLKIANKMCCSYVAGPDIHDFAIAMKQIRNLSTTENQTKRS